MNAKSSCFKFVNGSTLTFQYSSRTRLPIAIATTQNNKGHLWGLAAHINAGGRLDISNAQEELLYWHNIFGRCNIRETQKICRPTGSHHITQAIRS